MFIEKKFFYHIRRPYKELDSVLHQIVNQSNYNWSVGKTLQIGERENLYFKQMNKFENALNINGTKVYIMTLLKHLSQVENGEVQLNPLARTYHKNYKELVGLSYRVLRKSLRSVRELIFEEIRKENYSQLPSRSKCIWLIEDEKSLSYWSKLLQGEIYKVEVTGEIHKGSDSYLQVETYSLDFFREQAHKYWKGDPLDGVKDEIIFTGELEVIENMK
ncbi:MAG: hypothetical protein HeimC3_53150 [Candidatus Heimdallarchaeota archaeon LC_3]|nr:MAG: hypothetical protein HeimC3_53150 [Candidatus Heimdallarchaeota archaeon LC_3]